MNPQNWSDEKIVQYLAHQLPDTEMQALELDLRHNQQLRERFQALETDSEVHSVGEIWRRSRISCPSRQELAQELEGHNSSGVSDYIGFHLEVVSCAICRANYEDLQNRSNSSVVDQRRAQIFESSAGFLKPRDQSSQ